MLPRQDSKIAHKIFSGYRSIKNVMSGVRAGGWDAMALFELSKIIWLGRFAPRKMKTVQVPKG